MKKIYLVFTETKDGKHYSHAETIKRMLFVKSQSIAKMKDISLMKLKLSDYLTISELLRYKNNLEKFLKCH